LILDFLIDQADKERQEINDGRMKRQGVIWDTLKHLSYKIESLLNPIVCIDFHHQFKRF
jgi:sugar lactone lactonase YvrE